MNNMRNNGTVGIIESTDFDTTTTVHFSEWWNGEGLDFEVTHGRESKRIALHINEMHLLVTSMVASGMIDLREVKGAADRLVAESKARQDYIDKISL